MLDLPDELDLLELLPDELPEDPDPDPDLEDPDDPVERPLLAVSAAFLAFLGVTGSVVVLVVAAVESSTADSSAASARASSGPAPAASSVVGRLVTGATDDTVLAPLEVPYEADEPEEDPGVVHGCAGSDELCAAHAFHPA